MNCAYASSQLTYNRQLERFNLLFDLHHDPIRDRIKQLTVHPLSYYGESTPPPSPSLSPSEERAAWREFRKTGCLKAKEKLVRQYLCWALKLAKKYKGPRLDIDEAVSVANSGLIEAIGRFKPGRKKKFIVYSYMIINRHLIEALVNTYPAKVSTDLRKRMRSMKEDEALVAKALEKGEPTSLEELFERLGQATDFQLDLQFERPEDCMSTPATPEDPAEASASMALSDELRKAIQTQLNDLEREAIMERHFREVPKSFEQIGRYLGEPKNKVREAYNMAIVKLRRHLT